MNGRAVVFDLDGTLLDTLADIAAAANRTLAAWGYPTHPVQTYRWFVGDGSALLIERAMPAGERTAARISECLAVHLADYDRHWAVATRPYDGIPELLDRLADRGMPFAVVTNKPQDAALKTLHHFFPQTTFDSICGLQTGVQRKPDPTQTLQACHAMGVAPADCLFLGDSGVDMQAAVNAGLIAIGAGWGYRTVEELTLAGACRVITHPLDLVDWL